ncbi:protein of unknown function [Pseudorhizobium banfieldiae]|uniref:Uncharacterized protein n=1 Tax=Pseudorhizobium banfieldiae TaxID=1125847 RepID=L0NE36_9HYPH|nr:hypothetical protein [Pseudorhizobium banfieldiae]CAD6606094.1 hypothetical protein RNT25_01783 [arsenite-oxidising bacterium NT-25]CCF19129.1 protein of unknown function [Pseudorhizobium banfieldiae]
MPKFKAPNGMPITCILEKVPCIVGLESISEDGTEVEYDGNGSDVIWDEQKPVKRGGSFVFLDEDGEEWTFDQLTKVEE